MYSAPYIVVISGYEGIEEIFGPFNAQDALLVHNQLKQDCVAHGHDSEFGEVKYGISCCLPDDPDRICIMKSLETGNKRMDCCCEEFPDRIPNGKTWWR